MNRRKFTTLLAGLGWFKKRERRPAWLNGMGRISRLSGAEPVPLDRAGYRNPQLPIEQRTSDLLRRMSLAEKVEQMRGGLTRSYGILDPTGEITSADIHGNFRQIYDMHSRRRPRAQAALRNALQRYAMEKTRLGIPQIFQDESLHGYTAAGATSFPQAIALASTWDPGLLERCFDAAGDEAGSAGINQVFAPVLNLARDPRWGRTPETYGEDPYLTARLGVAAIRGLQGGNYLIDRHHVLSTAKHFAAHGYPQGGRNRAPANYSERVLRETSFVAFRAAVEEARVGSVMAAYNEINGGIPCHINRWLLVDILRGEWGFNGYVTSDGAGLEMLVETHRVAADFVEAARLALAAGLDYDRSQGSVYATLYDQARAGLVPENQIDRAVTRILAMKFRLGLFDNPYSDPEYAERITNCAAHRALALEAAQKAIVLLKNEGNLLPLDLRKYRKIAVIGPLAAGVHLGGYSRPPGGPGISLLEGIRRRAGAARVRYEEGCQLDIVKHGQAFLPHDLQAQQARLRSAARAARQSDVAIVVVGENTALCQEAWGRHRGDADTLNLGGAQNRLIRTILATGTPTVVFLLNGRPLSINYAAEHAPAILEGWYLGQEGGTAAAQVLFGDINPSGKLPITFPRSVGDLPSFYYHKPSAEQPYLFEKRGPLFPFGYGLSYARYQYSELKLSPARIATEGETTASLTVHNIGSRAGEEIVQLYLRDRVSSVTRPVKQLAGFQRLRLAPGEAQTVRFRLTPAELGFYNAGMHWVVEPGWFDIMAGSNSAETIHAALEIA